VHLHGPEPGEQSSRQSGFHSTGVVHDLAFLLIHCQALGEMQRNVGLAQHVFGGVAQPKVGTEGQRGEESYAGGFHVPIVRLRRSLSGGDWPWWKRSTWRTTLGRARSVGKWYFR
jgi:hypothetical protein